MKLTVSEVMTTDVLTVPGSMPYKDVVRLVHLAQVSALPVVDEAGCLVGIISEADLLLKEEHANGRRHRLGKKRRTVEQEKAAGIVAGQVMTSPVVTVRAGAPVGEAARAMHKHAVKRLVVVDETGKIAGIVSRSDVLKVFLRSDSDICREVVHDVIERELWLTPEEAHVDVTVDNGVVRLEGSIDRKGTVEILIGLVYGIEGVVGVDNRLRYESDDPRRLMIP